VPVEALAAGAVVVGGVSAVALVWRYLRIQA
jgi:hypothetical protein